MNNYLQQFIGAWLHPWATMRMVKEQPQETSIVPSMIYIVIMGFLSGLITSIAAMFNPGALPPGVPKWSMWLTVPLLPLFYFIGSFLSAGLVWGIVGGFLRGSKDEYKTIYRLMAIPVAFYPVSTLLAQIPMVGEWLAVAINIWATVVLISGVIIVMDTPKARTWVTFVILFLGIVLLALMANMASNPQFGRGFPTGSGFTNDADDFNLDDAAGDDKQLEELLKDQGKAPVKK